MGMTAKKKCEHADANCQGPVRRTIDPYQDELFGIKVKMALCGWHLQARRDDI